MYVEVSVDGSVRPGNSGHSGMAYHCTTSSGTRIGWASGPLCTSYVAEYMALEFAIESLGLTTMDYGLINSDCLTLVTQLTNGQACSRALLDLSWRLRRLPGLRLQYVRGHKGHPGNESADYHAHQAAERGRTNSDLSLFVPASQPSGRFLETEVLPVVGRLPEDQRSFVRSLHQRLRSGGLPPSRVETSRLLQFMQPRGGDDAVSVLVR